jgi:glycosyltransferase involved in cell wall biosynthesis
MPHSLPASKIRLLWLADHLGYAGETIHGATTYYMSILPRLQQAGVHLVPCFLGRTHPAVVFLRRKGLEPIFLNRSKWSPWALPDVLRLIRQRRINLVHAAGMKSILLGRVASKLVDVQTISHYHDTNRAGRVPEWLLRATAPWDASCFAISDAVARFAMQTLGTGADCTRILYNGVDTEEIVAVSPGERQRIRSSFGIAADAPVVGVIGRLAREKGQLQFLQALPALLSAMPDVKVLLVGDGPLRRDCQRLVSSLGLEPAVRFAGFRCDIPAILQALDVVAVPSLAEGLSFVALEAMAAGKPVVASAVGGLPEIVRPGETGLLAGAGDTGGLMEAIRSCLLDLALRDQLVTGGLALVQKLSAEAHVRELLGEYARVLERGTAGRGPARQDEDLRRVAVAPGPEPRQR